LLAAALLDSFKLLTIRDDMGIRFLYPLDLMDLRDDDVGQGAFILNTDKQKDIRLSEAGMGLFDPREFLE
jgi:hypothetical protein